MNNSKFSFQGNGIVENPSGSEGWKTLHRISLDSVDHPADYHTEDQGLVAAVNTALTLGMPLLLTGAPGVGKTQLAYRIAHELGCSTPIFFPVKSGSEAQDLFYHVDHLRRLHAAQITRSGQVSNGFEPTAAGSEPPAGGDTHDPVDIRRFIRFQGLGLAILRAMDKDQLQKLGLWDHAWPKSERQNLGYGERQPSVVLIDEIDKAPIDFANDMLEEIRKLEFLLRELGARPISLYAEPTQPTMDEKRYRPQVIITSNSEKGLPEPFLRRCIYYHIETPDQSVLKTIIEKRLAHGVVLPDREFQDRCVEFFTFLRDDQNLDKAPSTGELLSWFLIMAESKTPWSVDDIGGERWRDTAGHCLIKTEQDKARLGLLVQSWQDRR